MGRSVKHELTTERRISEMFICIREIELQSEAKRVLWVTAETESFCSSVSQTFPRVTAAQTSTRFHQQLERNQNNKRSLLRSFAIFLLELRPQTGGALSNHHLSELLPAGLFVFP